MRNLAIFFFLVIFPFAASAEDRREGYYYPKVQSEEWFERSIGSAPPAGRIVRTAFITQIVNAQLKAPENPPFSIFAKGTKADHMIIVALDDEVFKTLFRARGVLAQLSANARRTDFFVKNRISHVATWFDLAKLLGFRDIVITDGENWSHRIILGDKPAAVPTSEGTGSD